MIDVRHLTYAYPTADEAAVRDVSFQIGAGQVFGFLGPSGAGKSTTQKALTKLLPGYQGDVSVLGRDLRDWKNDYYNHIGVGFELPNHYTKLTALENLRLFAAFYDRPSLDPLSLLERVGLGAAAHKKVAEFSKGMKMRLNFVRALLHDPDILFFDEPTSGLDPGNAQVLREIILEQRQQGKAIFLTTHKMSDAEALCDQVAFIVDGQLAAVAPPEELKRHYGRRKVRVTYGREEERIAEFDLDELGQNEVFLTLLREHYIRTIHSEEATLDQVFIEITGRRLDQFPVG